MLLFITFSYLIPSTAGELCFWSRVSYVVCYAVFFYHLTVRENNSRRAETYGIDWQWYSLLNAVKFVRWQHLAMGRRARFAVPCIICYYIASIYTNSWILSA